MSEQPLPSSVILRIVAWSDLETNKLGDLITQGPEHDQAGWTSALSCALVPARWGPGMIDNSFHAPLGGLISLSPLL